MAGGFEALPRLQQLLLREPLARGERSSLSPGPLSDEEAHCTSPPGSLQQPSWEVERGLVEQYVSFLRTRRLCVLYVLEATLQIFADRCILKMLRLCSHCRHKRAAWSCILRVPRQHSRCQCQLLRSKRLRLSLLWSAQPRSAGTLVLFRSDELSYAYASLPKLTLGFIS